ncbi:hypothetical protein BvCmsKSNP018_04427 [Escherichia coli]|nr:hypothetical protein BvCmsKSNP018_04427 [Escherichia coli]
MIGNFAKVVGIGPNKLFAWMRDHKILIASGSRRNVPMQEYMERGYFTVKETAVRPSAMQSAIGGGASGAIAGAGLAKLIGSSTPWGAAIGGGLGLLGSLF